MKYNEFPLKKKEKKINLVQNTIFNGTIIFFLCMYFQVVNILASKRLQLILLFILKCHNRILIFKKSLDWQ